MQKLPTFNNWRTFLYERNVNDAYCECLLNYIRPLCQNRVPVIFEFEHLAKLLGRTDRYLASVISSSESHYREFTIPKRSGGHRNIVAPYPALLDVQDWVLRNILDQIKSHPCAHGFEKKKSIVSNAKLHLRQSELLKCDLKDFFPSISFDRVFYVFKSLGYARNVSSYLARLCTLEGRLPQGAPTSPKLANLVARRMDRRLYALARASNCRYTRYADDIAFSGKKIDEGLAWLVRSIICDEEFQINEKKYRLLREGNKKILTGISISSGKCKLPRKTKRKLKQEVYFVLKWGVNSHLSKRGHWRLVEPDAEFPQNAIKQLIELV